ncbi:hypothetical protein AAG906_023101 [Vitis piasezkii]
MSCRSYSAHRFSISARGGVTSTSEAGKTKKNVRLREGVRWTNEDKLIELLTEREFRERFRMPCGIAICLMDGGPVSTEEESFNAIVFSKEQFNVGLRFLLPSLFKIAADMPYLVHTGKGMRDQLNLLALVQDLESYVVHTLLRFAPRVLVLDEHYVLKDLSFYTEARKREKKRQEGTLRQASGAGHSTTNSSVHPPIKKKSVPQPVEKALDLSLSPSLSAERLSEALPTTPLPAKKSRLEAPREESAPDTPMVQSIPCFTTLEPSALGLNAFFSMTRHRFVKLRDDPRLASVVRLFHGTPESVLRCTYPMQKYTAKETTEVVAESMQTFLIQKIDNNEEHCAQLVRVESELTAVRKAVADAEKLLKELEEGMQVAKDEACRMGYEKKTVKAKCKDAEQEKDQLKKELEELRRAYEA